MVVSNKEIIEILIEYDIDYLTAKEIAKKIHIKEMSIKHIIKNTKGKWKNKLR